MAILNLKKPLRFAERGDENIYTWIQCSNETIFDNLVHFLGDNFLWEYDLLYFLTKKS
jgi:hypothetical protein